MTDNNNPYSLNSRHVLYFFLFAIALRISGLFNVYFYEEDEISIAAGVAALVRDNVGDFYRYTPQLGYYRLIQFIAQILGGDVNLIPAIMKYLSALMGTLIPVMALYLFRNELSTRARWLTAFILLANPILWKSSQYGNTAMVATCISLAAITLLSNQPRKPQTLLALCLFVAAILVRADTVLLVPVIAFLLYRNHASIKTAFIYLVFLGISLLAIYALLFTFDSHIDNAVSAVSSHFTLPRPTMFWEYLLWALSPIVAIFAIVGLRQLLIAQHGLLLTLLIWCVPVLGFYFASTTTPRYFLLPITPLAIAAAIGMLDIKHLLQNHMPARAAAIAVFGAAFLHLFIGLGHFHSNWRASPLYGPGFMTDDGLMPAGALIYDTYLRRGPFYQSFNNPGFGKASQPFWEGPVHNKILDQLQQHRQHKTTVILFDKGFWHAFHFHAQARGAEYLSRKPTMSATPFASETWLKLGQAMVMTIAYQSTYYDALQQFKVKAGDEIWLLSDKPFPTAAELQKMPPGLKLVEITSFHDKIRVFSVK